MSKPTADTLKSDIQFVRKIKDECGDWRRTNFVQSGGYSLDDPLKVLEETCERALAKLFQQYGEAVFPK